MPSVLPKVEMLGGSLVAIVRSLTDSDGAAQFIFSRKKLDYIRIGTSSVNWKQNFDNVRPQAPSSGRFDSPATLIVLHKCSGKSSSQISDPRRSGTPQYRSAAIETERRSGCARCLQAFCQAEGGKNHKQLPSN